MKTKNSFTHHIDLIATIGPTLETEEAIAAAIDAGAGWFRLPMGYRTRDHVEHGMRVRRVAASRGREVKLLFDLPSERLRLGETAPLEVSPGIECWLVQSGQPAPANALQVPSLEKLTGVVSPGHRVLALDGRIVLRVLELQGSAMLVRVERGTGRLQTNNSLVFPDSDVSYALVTEEDISLLQRAADSGIHPDWIAFSLVRSADQFNAACEMLRPIFPRHVSFMAKLETQAAIRQGDGLVNAADGIMVARGDLGLVVKPEELPQIQARLVATARTGGKSVVVATQFLENFAETGVPQRCELTDLVVAAQQQATAVMLGKETVFSRHPIESIELARRCLDTASEPHLPPAIFLREPRNTIQPNATRLIALEGGNGTGKTTLMERIKTDHPEWLMQRGVPDAWMEPKMKMRMIRDADWMASALYFFSGTLELTRELMLSLQTITPPPVVFLDRCLWSTLAVQVGHDPERLWELLPVLEGMSGHVCIPNTTVILTASLETLRKRISTKDSSERAFDELTQNYAYWERELLFYGWLKQAIAEVGLPQYRVEILDTDNLSFDAVASHVESLVAL